MLRFRDLGCFVFEFWVLRASVFVFVFDLGCFVFEFWVLRFRDLGCFVFEFWVLRASVFVFECFVFETTISDRLFPLYTHSEDVFEGKYRSLDDPSLCTK